MKYVMVWTIPTDNFAATVKRFKEADPKFPKVRIIARLHEMGTGKGFTLWETDDPVRAAIAAAVAG